MFCPPFYKKVLLFRDRSPRLSNFEKLPNVGSKSFVPRCGGCLGGGRCDPFQRVYHYIVLHTRPNFFFFTSPPKLGCHNCTKQNPDILVSTKWGPIFPCVCEVLQNGPFILIPRIISYPKTTSIFGIRLKKTTTLLQGGIHKECLSTRIESKTMQVSFRFVSSFFLDWHPSKAREKPRSLTYTHEDHQSPFFV